MITCMYGGSFDPLTIGHLHCIEEALKACDKLYLVLSYSLKRDRVNYKVRSTWLKKASDDFKCISCFKDKEIQIVLVEDNYCDKDTYNWEDGRDDILKACKVDRFDKVCCGSDYEGKGVFEHLYPTSEIIYVSRDDGISSTRVWHNLYRQDNWSSMPNYVQKHFTKRVLFIGGESVGKSTMTEDFAKMYDTSFVPEYGRFVSERSLDEYTMPDTDFAEILVRHKASEYEALKKANKVMFIDTDALTTLFYSHLLIGNFDLLEKTSNLAKSIATLYKDTYDLIVFLEVSDDTPFVQDGTRNEDIGSNRKQFSDLLKSYYDSFGYKYIEMSGTYKERYATVKQMVDNLLK